MKVISLPLAGFFMYLWFSVMSECWHSVANDGATALPLALVGGLVGTVFFGGLAYAMIEVGWERGKD